MTVASLDRVLAAVRTATAGLALAVALLLLLHVPLVALLALAALELLSFGRRTLSSAVPWAEWVALGVKLAVLGLAYVALSG